LNSANGGKSTSLILLHFAIELGVTHALIHLRAVRPKILVSAGEASGDLYASQLVNAIRRQHPDADFFGCAGPRMRKAGVREVVDAGSLAVVGLVEVLHHIPRIYGEFRKLVEAARNERPDLAILTDSPDFNLRVATKLRKLGIPVLYLIAPQVWAWREGRVNRMRRDLERVLSIFPFEEEYFARHGVAATYIGHPLTWTVRPALSRAEFFAKHGLDDLKPLITMLPGSRVGEVARHLPAVVDAAATLQKRYEANVVLATPVQFSARAGASFFQERISGSSIQVLEGETSDALAHADVAIAASGTVTIEAAILGTPMVTFYKVTALSWALGRFLVRVPYYSMVNLVAGRKVVPELMQNEATGDRLAAEALRLLEDAGSREEMKRSLEDVRSKLAAPDHPMERAARIVDEYLKRPAV
jgi:lipid-A-disaccharide synthase